MEEKKVSWLELFFDLVFVTAVSFTTHLFVEIEHQPDRMHLYLGEYLLMVFPMFWLWTGQTMFFNRYGELIRRPEIYMLPQMFFFILMTASLDFEFAHSYHSYLASYLGLRLLTVIQYFLVDQRLKGPKKEVARLLGSLFIPGLLIPLSSLFFVGRWHYVVMYSGIAADMILPLFFSRKLTKAPVNLPHLTERFGLFVLITFGESLVTITNILTGRTADPSTLAYSLLSFMIIGLMWYSYYYTYDNVVDRHKETNGQILLYGHFFILVSVMLLAGDLEMLHDGQLPESILLFFLYIPVFLFFAAKELVFYHHRLKDRQYYEVEGGLALAAFILAFGGNFFLDLSALENLALVALGCLLQIAIQLGVHTKLGLAGGQKSDPEPKARQKH